MILGSPLLVNSERVLASLNRRHDRDFGTLGEEGFPICPTLIDGQQNASVPFAERRGAGIEVIKKIAESPFPIIGQGFFGLALADDILQGRKVEDADCHEALEGLIS